MGVSLWSLLAPNLRALCQCEEFPRNFMHGCMGYLLGPNLVRPCLPSKEEGFMTGSYGTTCSVSSSQQARSL
ncbi:uncharacterized protein EDB93DRAFT_1157464 [Suillus bovinus]|uniref:uncharacterized protein n=1 Tax=Suillus bovinus TaxID=48563 RepID=UPI001B885C55|nr:uncharacterized protein EDB93DRAFT_1157464 [Suillus bovinus]KAG2142756.1 hypothetical protein EDB93DRAFT_1157464 [Suillus bovinus]